jgi:hypothetical protein
MDSEGLSFQSGLALSSSGNVPPRCPAAMPAGEIVAWTPTRILAAMGAWVMEETQLPGGVPASLSVTAPNRRA